MPRPVRRDLHTVLGSSTRAAILSLLRNAGRPRHASDLAADLDRHVSTVRDHLAVLEQAGLIRRVEHPADEPPQHAGRPRVFFEATPGALDRDPAVCAGNRFLAQVLAAYVEGTADDPRRAAEEAGSAWGRHLINAEPYTRTSDEDALRQIAEMSEALGLDPEVTATGTGAVQVRLRRCPFRDVQERHGSIACGIHRGLLAGALAELGSSLDVDAFLPHEPEGECVAVLRSHPRRAPDGAGAR